MYIYANSKLSVEMTFTHCNRDAVGVCKIPEQISKTLLKIVFINFVTHDICHLRKGDNDGGPGAEASHKRMRHKAHDHLKKWRGDHIYNAHQKRKGSGEGPILRVINERLRGSAFAWTLSVSCGNRFGCVDTTVLCAQLIAQRDGLIDEE